MYREQKCILCECHLFAQGRGTMVLESACRRVDFAGDPMAHRFSYPSSSPEAVQEDLGPTPSADKKHGSAGEGVARPEPRASAVGRKRGSPEPADGSRQRAHRRRRSPAAASPAGTPLARAEAPGSSGGRRVPARLAPWTCSECTLTNAGPAAACTACGTPRSAAQAPTMPSGPPLQDRQGGAPVHGQQRRHGTAAAETRAAAGAAREQAPRAGRKASLVTPAQVRPPEGSQKLGGGRALQKRRRLALSAAAACNKAHKQSAVPGQAAAGRARRARQSEARGVDPGGSRSVSPRRAGGAAAEGRGSRMPLSGGRVQTQAAGRASGRWRTQQPRWVLLASQLGAPENVALGRVAAAAGARVAPRWEPGVTHVVCGVTHTGAARRTFKFLMAVLGARWIVAPSWLAACEVAAGAVPEEPHEARWRALCLCLLCSWLPAWRISAQ